MGEGSGALAWLTGDFLGTGRAQIAQLWDNNGTLGLLVYGADPGGYVQKVDSFPDTGQGSGALAWLTGNFYGTGRTEIAQPWDNNGTLGLNVYGKDPLDSGWNVLPYPDLGQGPHAVAWLTGDFLNLGRAQIAQPWDNHGTLGLIVYGHFGGEVVTEFNSYDMGQGSGALAWLTGDFLDLGYPQIAQPWKSLGRVDRTGRCAVPARSASAAAIRPEDRDGLMTTQNAAARRPSLAAAGRHNKTSTSFTPEPYASVKTPAG
jgi:hypothetical protein